MTSTNTEFPPLLDSQGGIVNCGGLKDLYIRALLRFQADLNSRQLPPEAPDADEDWKRWAHSLKSTSALLGARSLNEAVKDVENFWRQNQDPPRESWNNLILQYSEVRSSLDKWSTSRSKA